MYMYVCMYMCVYIYIYNNNNNNNNIMHYNTRQDQPISGVRSVRDPTLLRRAPVERLAFG